MEHSGQTVSKNATAPRAGATLKLAFAMRAIVLEDGQGQTVNNPVMTDSMASSAEKSVAFVKEGSLATKSPESAKFARLAFKQDFAR